MRSFSACLAGAIGALLLAFIAQSYAGKRPPAMEVRLTGDLMCAKCVLKESDHCQLVLRYTTVAQKQVTYYLDENSVASKFHDQVGQAAKRVRATGAIKKQGSRLTFTASELALVN